MSAIKGLIGDLKNLHDLLHVEYGKATTPTVRQGIEAEHAIVTRALIILEDQHGDTPQPSTPDATVPSS
jgi:hypothetical protein